MKTKLYLDELPDARPLTPGDYLRDILEERGLSQQAFADALGVTRRRLNEILNDRRGISSDTALRLGRVLGTTAEVWLRFQNQVDIWDTINGPAAKEIAKLDPLTAA